MLRSRRLFVIAAIIMGISLSLVSCSAGGSSSTSSGPVGEGGGLLPESIEYTEAIVTCLQDHGLSVELDDETAAPPGISFDDRLVSMEVLQSNYDSCVEELTTAGILAPVNSGSPEHRRELYAAFLEAAVCIRGLGYDVPPAPSEETFVDGSTVWNPFDAVPGTVGPEELNRVYRECGI